MVRQTAVLLALVGLAAACESVDDNDIYKSGPPKITNQPATHGAFQKGYIQVLSGGKRPGTGGNPNYVVQGGLCMFDDGSYLLTQDWFIYHPAGGPTSFITWGTYTTVSADTVAFSSPFSASARSAGDSITFSGPSGPTEVFLAVKNSNYPAISCQ